MKNQIEQLKDYLENVEDNLLNTENYEKNKTKIAYLKGVKDGIIDAINILTLWKIEN